MATGSRYIKSVCHAWASFFLGYIFRYIEKVFDLLKGVRVSAFATLKMVIVAAWQDRRQKLINCLIHFKTIKHFIIESPTFLSYTL